MVFCPAPGEGCGLEDAKRCARDMDIRFSELQVINNIHITISVKIAQPRLNKSTTTSFIYKRAHIAGQNVDFHYVDSLVIHCYIMKV